MTDQEKDPPPESNYLLVAQGEFGPEMHEFSAPDDAVALQLALQLVMTEMYPECEAPEAHLLHVRQVPDAGALALRIAKTYRALEISRESEESEAAEEEEREELARLKAKYEEKSC